MFFFTFHCVDGELKREIFIAWAYLDRVRLDSDFKKILFTWPVILLEPTIHDIFTYVQNAVFTILNCI